MDEVSEIKSLRRGKGKRKSEITISWEPGKFQALPWSATQDCHYLGTVLEWEIDGETTKTVTDFIFLGSKVTADGDWSHEIKRCLLLGRKTMISLDSILKSRDITLLTTVHLVKAMVFPVVMYGCKSWTIKLSALEFMLFFFCRAEFY